MSAPRANLFGPGPAAPRAARRTNIGLLVAALLLLVAVVAGWQLNRAAVLAAWLAGWWFWIGLVMGGLTQVWLHNLTGGNWGEAIREPLLERARPLWIGALLFVPVLLAMPDIYPWAATGGPPAARWSGELSAPAFKRSWLQVGPFVLRSILWLATWCVLAALSRQPRFARSQGFAALALLLYCFTMSLASLDWIMSLMPLWYSSVFGLLVLTVQSQGAMALAIVLAVRRGASHEVLGDLGNLLLAYAMSWVYLAFMQYLIIWAENLPHEILWFTARSGLGWRLVAWMLALLLFAVPAVLLLFRAVKRNPAALARLAWLVLAMALVHAWWLVLPSVPAGSGQWLWAAPLGTAAALAVAALCWRWAAPHTREAR